MTNILTSHLLRPHLSSGLLHLLTSVKTQEGPKTSERCCAYRFNLLHEFKVVSLGSFRCSATTTAETFQAHPVGFGRWNHTSIGKPWYLTELYIIIAFQVLLMY